MPQGFPYCLECGHNPCACDELAAAEAREREILELQRLAQGAEDDVVDDAELAEEREKDAWYDAHHRYPSDHSEEWSDLQKGLL